MKRFEVKFHFDDMSAMLNVEASKQSEALRKAVVKLLHRFGNVKLNRVECN